MAENNNDNKKSIGTKIVDALLGPKVEYPNMPDDYALGDLNDIGSAADIRRVRGPDVVGYSTSRLKDGDSIERVKSAFKQDFAHIARTLRMQNQKISRIERQTNEIRDSVIGRVTAVNNRVNTISNQITRLTIQVNALQASINRRDSERQKEAKSFGPGTGPAGSGPGLLDLAGPALTGAGLARLIGRAGLAGLGGLLAYKGLDHIGEKNEERDRSLGIDDKTSQEDISKLRKKFHADRKRSGYDDERRETERLKKLYPAEPEPEKRDPYKIPRKSDGTIDYENIPRVHGGIGWKKKKATVKNINDPRSSGTNNLNMANQYQEPFDILYHRQKTDEMKSKFMQFGQLPQGFEFLPGHMGTLGNPGAVAARGAMPIGGGYTPGYPGGRSPSYGSVTPSPGGGTPSTPGTPSPSGTPPSPGGGSPDLRTPSAPGMYRPARQLTDRDLSPQVINVIAGEAYTNNPTSVDAVINNMFNRLGSKSYKSNDLHDVVTAPGQYTGHRRATPKEREFIESRIRAIASGSQPDITNGANEYRATSYVRGAGRGKTFARTAAEQGNLELGGNTYARTKYQPGPYAAYSAEERAQMSKKSIEKVASERGPFGDMFNQGAVNYKDHPGGLVVPKGGDLNAVGEELKALGVPGGPMKLGGPKTPEESYMLGMMGIKGQWGKDGLANQQEIAKLYGHQLKALQSSGENGYNSDQVREAIQSLKEGDGKIRGAVAYSGGAYNLRNLFNHPDYKALPEHVRKNFESGQIVAHGVPFKQDAFPQGVNAKVFGDLGGPHATATARTLEQLKGMDWGQRIAENTGPRPTPVGKIQPPNNSDLAKNNMLPGTDMTPIQKPGFNPNAVPDAVNLARPNFQTGQVTVPGMAPVPFSAGSKNNPNFPAPPLGAYTILPHHTRGYPDTFSLNPLGAKSETGFRDPKTANRRLPGAGPLREGVLFHSLKSEQLHATLGCLGIPPSKWGEFKARIKEMHKKHGVDNVVGVYGPNGAEIMSLNDYNAKYPMVPVVQPNEYIRNFQKAYPKEFSEIEKQATRDQIEFLAPKVPGTMLNSPNAPFPELEGPKPEISTKPGEFQNLTPPGADVIPRPDTDPGVIVGRPVGPDGKPIGGSAPGGTPIAGTPVGPNSNIPVPQDFSSPGALPIPSASPLASPGPAPVTPPSPMESFKPPGSEIVDGSPLKDAPAPGATPEPGATPSGPAGPSGPGPGGGNEFPSNNPESAPESPGSGGSGSYGRCFV